MSSFEWCGYLETVKIMVNIQTVIAKLAYGNYYSRGWLLLYKSLLLKNIRLYHYINVKHKLGKVLATSFLDTARKKVHKYRGVPSDNAVVPPPDKRVVQRKFTFHLWGTDNNQIVNKRYGHNCCKRSIFAKLTRGDRWLPLEAFMLFPCKGLLWWCSW